MRMILIAFSVVVLSAPFASAGVPGAEKLAEAERLAKDKQYAEAAEIYGKELATAQKKKDLAWQERITKSLCSRMRVPVSGGAGERDAYASSLRTVMLALDARKNFAFCSAGQFSHALLLEATRTGDYAFVKEAAKVSVAHAKIKKVGPYAAVMGDYAAGLLSVAAGDYANAIPSLEAALEVTSRETWAWPSVHLATELAAAYVAVGRDDQAAATLTKAGAILTESGDRAMVQRLRLLVKTRLPEASEEVLGAYEAAMAPFSGGSSAGAAGGAGGAGGDSGGNDQSKVGRAWKRLSPKKPFVTVALTEEGYVIRQSFDRGFQADQPRKDGVKHHADGGITLSFWDGGVRLYMVDLEGRMGQPGESSDPGLFQFFHPLTKGYTWGVTKTGIVTQTRGR